jgi:hypothetical protein
VGGPSSRPPDGATERVKSTTGFGGAGSNQAHTWLTPLTGLIGVARIEDAVAHLSWRTAAPAINAGGTVPRLATLG